MAHCINETVLSARAATPVGARISSLGGLRSGRGPLGLGRLGGFAVARRARTWQNLMLLTNAHVLHAHETSAGDAVYSPRIVANGPRFEIDQSSLETLGRITNDGFEGHHRYQYRGDAPKDYFIDCGTATLSAERARPVGRRVISRVAMVAAEDTRPGRRLPVRLLGVHNESAGHLVDIAATVPHTDGRECYNTLVIESVPGKPPFAAEGDSGALVLDSFDRAIGLLWGIDLATPSRAFACHLPPVLDRLDLVVSRREAAQ